MVHLGKRAWASNANAHKLKIFCNADSVLFLSKLVSHCLLYNNYLSSTFMFNGLYVLLKKFFQN